jgi:hypothetical protein
LTLRAVGEDIYFNTQAASTTFQFQLYKNGVAVTPATASSTVAVNWTKPTGTTAYNTTGFILAEGQTVSLPVEYVISGVAGTFDSGSYSVGLKQINANPTNGGSVVATNFMDGMIEWRTNTVVLP